MGLVIHFNTALRPTPPTTSIPAQQDDEKKFLLLPEDGNHDVAIFDPATQQLGAEKACTYSPSVCCTSVGLCVRAIHREHRTDLTF